MKWVFLGIAGLIGIGMIIGSSDKKDSPRAAADSANIIVNAGKSSCVATGVADVYTGDGRVLFLIELRNTGTAGTVNVTPIRRYDDGETNESAMDMLVDVDVPGHSKTRLTEQYKYEAHVHDVVSCALRLSDGTETDIPVRHL